MKIAYCLPDYHWIAELRDGNPTDAAHIQQRYIADGLGARGHSITWVAPRELDYIVYADSLTEPSLAPQTWTAHGWFDLLGKAAWKIQQFFRIPYLNFFSNVRRFDAYVQILCKHDIAFERNSLYNSGVAMACKKLAIPYVMFFDADQIAELDFMGKPLTGLLRWRAQNLLRYNLKIAHQVVCVSNATRKLLITNWNVPSDKVVVLLNAVDINRFRPDPELGARTRASLQLMRHQLLIFVGSFYQWHDIVTLLKAFAVTLRTHSDARLVLLGDGIERQAMENLSIDLGIEHAVRFTGFVSHAEVSRYVNMADIAVVPVPNMEQEMWLSPMKLFEYMASGKAVIASAMGQIKDVVKDGENGLLVPAGDVMALASAIKRLLDDAPLMARLGQQAREDAVQNYSWDQYISNLEQMLTDVVRSPELV